MTNKNEIEVIQDGETIVDRIDYGTDTLREGMYAVIKKMPENISKTDSNLVVGDTLLVVGLKFAHNFLHAVTVLNHPRNTNDSSEHSSFSYLYDDFLDHFTVISVEQGEAIRQREIAALEKRNIAFKSDLDDLMSNPKRQQELAFAEYSKRISSKDIPANIDMSNISGMLGLGNSLELIEAIKAKANMASDLIGIQQDIIKKKTAQLQKLIDEVMPFYSERFKAVVSSTTEYTDLAKTLGDGIKSLGLYTGDDVSVYTIINGVEASSEIPLTLVQKALYADEELAFFCEEARRLDVDNVERFFFDRLKETPALVNQIFPTERCMLVMAIRRTYIDYQDRYYNMVMNKANQASFLMVRNGENIHVVYSPIGSHLAAKNLFPSRDYLEKHFLHWKGEIQIDINHLQYSDSLAAADREILHYKRFLLLIAGLQHRENLFGNFYKLEETFNIFFPEFQNKYFNFIHDDDGEGLIEGEKRLSLTGFIDQHNEYLSKGSWILCDTRQMINKDTAPACFRYSWRYGNKDNNGYNEIKRPVERYVLAQVQEDKKGLFVKISCTNEGVTYSDKIHTVDVRVEVSRSYINRSERLDHLVLDNMSASALLHYISQRKYRGDYMKYIELFKQARIMLGTLKESFKTEYSYFENAIEHIPDRIPMKDFELESRLMEASSFFKNKDAQKLGLNYLHTILSKQHQNKVATWAINIAKNSTDLTPIAVSIGRTGETHLYCEMPESEQLNDITPNAWVRKYTFKNIKKLPEQYERVGIRDSFKDERILVTLDQAKYDYYANDVGGRRDFESYDAKVNFFEAMQHSKHFIQAFVSDSLSRSDVNILLAAMNEVSKNKGCYVKEFGFPVFVAKNLEVYGIQMDGFEGYLKGLKSQYDKDSSLEIAEQYHTRCKMTMIGSGYFSQAFVFNSRGNRTEYEYSEQSIGYLLATSGKSSRWSFGDDKPKDIIYSIFDKKYFEEYSNELDIELGNTAIIESQKFKLEKMTINVYKSHRKNEVGNVAQSINAIGTRKQLDLLAAEYQAKADVWLENFKDNKDFKVRFEINIHNSYIVDTRDLEDFMKETRSIDPNNMPWDAERELYMQSNISLF